MSFKQQLSQKLSTNRTLLSALLFALSLSSLHAGTALRLYYRNIPGSNVANLTSHASFPDRPDSAEPITYKLEKMAESGDQLGTWTRGYVEAPQTGNFVFMIASDDHSEFWLSSNHDPKNKKKIAVNNHWVEPGAYSARPEQRSEPIPLVKGEKYYFELFHKELTKRDYVSVAWQWPDGTMEASLSATHLLPFPVDDAYRPVEKAPVILKEYFGQPVATLTNVSLWEGESAAFTVTVEASAPMTIQWYRNREPIPGANTQTYTLPKASITNDVDIISVVVSNKLGEAKAEAVLSVLSEKIPPTVSSVLSRSDSGLMVSFSKSVDLESASTVENYLVDGIAVKEAIVSGDRKSVILKAAALAPGRVHQLQIRNVKDLADPPNVMTPATFSIKRAAQIWYTFDEINPTNIVDVSGNGFNAVLYNDPAYSSEGKVGGCMVFNGDGQYGMIPDESYDFSRGMTIALWAKPTSVRAWSRFIDFGNGPTADNIILGRHQGSEGLFFEIYEGKMSRGQIVATGALELNQWQHFVVTVDEKGSVAIYKDGVVIKEAKARTPTKKSRTNNYVARSNWAPDKFYAGALDDLRIYERALTSDEIKTLAEGLSDVAH